MFQIIFQNDKFSTNSDQWVQLFCFIFVVITRKTTKQIIYPSHLYALAKPRLKLWQQRPQTGGGNLHTHTVDLLIYDCSTNLQKYSGRQAQNDCFHDHIRDCSDSFNLKILRRRGVAELFICSVSNHVYDMVSA